MDFRQWTVGGFGCWAPSSQGWGVPWVGPALPKAGPEIFFEGFWPLLARFWVGGSVSGVGGEWVGFLKKGGWGGFGPREKSPRRSLSKFMVPTV